MDAIGVPRRRCRKEERRPHVRDLQVSQASARLSAADALAQVGASGGAGRHCVDIHHLSLLHLGLIASRGSASHQPPPHSLIHFGRSFRDAILQLCENRCKREREREREGTRVGIATCLPSCVYKSSEQSHDRTSRSTIYSCTPFGIRKQTCKQRAIVLCIQVRLISMARLMMTALLSSWWQHHRHRHRPRRQSPDCPHRHLTLPTSRTQPW